METEQKEQLEEMEDQKESELERQARMRHRTKTLRERRESERQQLVADKLDQQFRYGGWLVLVRFINRVMCPLKISTVDEVELIL